MVLIIFIYNEIERLAANVMVQTTKCSVCLGCIILDRLVIVLSKLLEYAVTWAHSLSQC